VRIFGLVSGFDVGSVGQEMAGDAARIRQTAKSKDGFLRTVGIRVSLSDFWGLGPEASKEDAV
jgi:hypothetical protein